VKKSLLIFLIFNSSLVTLHAQHWLWAKQAFCSSGNPQMDYSTVVDRKGNVLIAGQFSNYIGYGSYACPTGGSYVFKFDSSGTCLWAKGSYPSGWGCSVTTDKWNNVYTTGDFANSDTFTPYTLGTKGGDMFLAKYDENGSIKWVRQSNVLGSGFPNYVIGYSVATDNSGNVYVTGRYSDTAVIGHDTLKTVNINSFIAKYDSAGNELWAKTTVTADSLAPADTVVANAITIYNGYLYVTGYFTGKLKFGTDSINGTGKDAAFLLKCDTSGKALWIRQVTSVIAGSSMGSSVVTDKAGCPYIAGKLTGKVKFGSTTTGYCLHTSPFLTKYDTAGNTKWVRYGTIVGGANWVGGNSVAADTMNHLYMLAVGPNIGAAGNIVFSSDTIIVNSSEGPFILIEYDTAGAFYGGSAVFSGWATVAAAPDASGIYVSGSFVDTDSLGTVITFKCSTNESFLAKWKGGTKPIIINNGIDNIPGNSDVSIVYPDPSNGKFTLAVNGEKFKTNSIVKIYNMLGKKIYSNSFNIQNSEFKIDISGQPAGIYMYRIVSEDGKGVATGKFIIDR
jgi:hypothetical protein